MVPGFQQGNSFQDFFNATFAELPVTVDSSFAHSVLRDITAGSSSRFSVRLLGNVGQKQLGKKQNREAGSLKTLCNLAVEFSQTSGILAEASVQDCVLLIQLNRELHYFL